MDGLTYDTSRLREVGNEFSTSSGGGDSVVRYARCRALSSFKLVSSAVSLPAVGRRMEGQRHTPSAATRDQPALSPNPGDGLRLAKRPAPGGVTHARLGAGRPRRACKIPGRVPRRTRKANGPTPAVLLPETMPPRTIGPR